jgi:agmatinase
VTPLAELDALLRPAGRGLFLVSTGVADQERLAAQLYGVTKPQDVERAHAERLERIVEAKVVILGVPSDVGAGYRRGASLAPAAIREAMLDADPAWPAAAEARGVLDVGDVFVVPQLLHDEMLSEAQKRSSRDALYPALPEDERRALPVSPLSMEERALDLVLQLNPRAKPFVLGGDHSVAWPVTAALYRARGGRPFAIVQPDAHTDLLSERLGVKYCFATWSHHANELLGRSGRLVQLGVRASRFPREHWESTLGVRQFWPDSYLSRPEAAADEVMAHLRGLGLDGVYLSNDIDGTDAAHAPSTGTPEPSGLDPEWLLALIDRIGREQRLIAADLVEVAPPLGSADDQKKTLALAARYARASIDALLRS